MLKSYGWGGGVVGWGGVGGLCDYCVSPSPFGLDFGTLDFGTGLDNKLSPHRFVEDYGEDDQSVAHERYEHHKNDTENL